ncbi:hypothetical protein [Rhodophyticola sp. CCM32]|uniref:hypothetical protein n=1 Tax=Rhodophyticola sp. CCM32 TaxID=2916397 RepID=UPI001AEFA5A4|nr:hypothetical protein [Rhodophyticola sp. CCM32]
MKLFLASIFVFLSMGVAAMACPNYQLGGNAFSYTGEQLYTPTTFGVQAGGNNSLTNCGLGSLGSGNFRSAPDYSFDLTGMDQYLLAIDVDSQCDAALLVNTANAQWLFDDDSNGNLDPRIELNNAAQLNGRVDIWVGTFSGGACSGTVTLETFFNQQAPAPAPVPAPAPLPANCPNWNMQGAQIQLTGDQLYAPQRYGVQAQGSMSASSCGEFQGTGYFSAAPQYSFYLSGMDAYRLAIDVVADCDTTLLVNTADTQWHFDDDGAGYPNPSLDLVGAQALNGRVDVWVGSYNGTPCNATLNMETFYASAPQPQPQPQPVSGCPTFALTGQQLNLTGQQLYSPQSYGLQAGGGADVSGCGINAGGYANAAPNYSFYLSGMEDYRLAIDVDSQCDTTLIVNTADGQWLYDDDSNGNLDPRMDIRGGNQLNGRVDVWVGTFGGSSCPATLNMETWLN